MSRHSGLILLLTIDKFKHDMTKHILKLTLLLVLVFNFSVNTNAQNLITKTAHIKFFSKEGGITANNYSVVSKLDKTTGDMVFSAPIQSFEFPNATMQKHFNQADVMDSQNFPKGKFVGKITNIKMVDFTKDGTYSVAVTGLLTIKGNTNKVSTEGTVTVKEGKIMATSEFTIDRFAYGVTGKEGSVSQHIALTINATYE